jgi:tetratricopeptide (TPR) repeat protein
MGIKCIAVRRILPFVLFTVLSTFVDSQETGKSAALRGTVRDSQGKLVAGATLRLLNNGEAQTVRSDAEGNYGFTAVGEGVYALRASMRGYSDTEIPSLFFGPKETKHVDLTLSPDKPVPSQPAEEPRFFDAPKFAVSGVTDTTNLGGHGSDTIVRTRETLAKETVWLNKSSDNTPLERRSETEQEKSLRERVAREPRSFEANYLLGKQLDEDGKAREAIAYLNHAHELQPGNYDSSYELALANAQAGNLESARDEAQALLQQADKAELHHLLADVQEKLGDSLAAVHEYERAADLDPRESYIFDWGSELLLHHAPEPAVDVFTRGNQLFPHSVRMLIALSAAWFSRGSYEQAARRICEASDLDPNDPMPYLFMGKMQSAEHDPSEQIVDKLRRFVALQPESAEANYYYAVALWRLRGASQDAAPAAQVESLLNRATHLDLKFAAAYLQLGILHAEEKDYPQAISDYEQAIQLDPKMEDAHYRLAQAYRQTGDAGKSAAELQVYNQVAKESAQELERERHEIRQFVYVLREQPATVR